MTELSLSAMVIRFLLGGGAVVASTLIAKKAGSKIGGIFAAFPAVYLAALFTIRFDVKGEQLIDTSILLSQGAIIGMGINIICAVAVVYLSTKQGWKRGLVQSLAGWFFLSIMVAFVTAQI